MEHSEITNGTANGNGGKSGSCRVDGDGHHLLEGMLQHSENIGAALQELTLTLIGLDEAWATRRALRAEGRLRHGYVAAKADEASAETDSSVCSLGGGHLDEVVVNLRREIEDAIGTIEQHAAPRTFQFQMTFMDQARLVQVIAWALTADTLPPRAEYEDLLASARKVLSILDDNITRLQEKGNEDADE
ncbi:MAG: hypothetical protein ACREPW_11345 [Candidatus Binataceae bacterium]